MKTEDAVEMPPNLPAIKGRAAIQQYYEKQFAAGKIARFSLTHLETRSMGDLGYDVGTYQQSVTPTGGAAMDGYGQVHGDSETNRQTLESRVCDLQQRSRDAWWWFDTVSCSDAEDVRRPLSQGVPSLGGFKG